jgi:hypothetical protein
VKQEDLIRYSCHVPYAKQNRAVYALLVPTLLGLLSMGIPAATAALGVSVSVIPDSNPPNSQLYTDNNKLWFISSKNEILRRTVLIRDMVGSDQRINLSIGAAKNQDGRVSFDNSVSSQIAPWVSFSENDFVLPSRSQKRIEISIKPDSGLDNFQQDAFLVVSTSSTRKEKEKPSDQPIKLVIPVQFAYTVPLFVGLGDLENLISFKVTDLNGYVDGNGKFLEATIENDGSSIIEPSGKVQLKLTDFTATPLGPFQFKVAQFRPNSSGVLVARVPENVLAANYEAFVEVQFGSFVDAKIFTKYLDFRPKRVFSLFDFSAIALGILIIAISILGWKRKESSFESSALTEIPNDVQVIHKSGLRHAVSEVLESLRYRLKNENVQSNSFPDDEVSILLSEILKKATTKKATTKKATTKKATTKKATTKKATTKKATTKKATTKKAT